MSKSKAGTAKKPGKSAGGRPSTYSAKLAAEICAYIAEHKTLRDALKQPGMPSETTAYRWLAERQEFREMYARAREQGDELDAERMREIAFDQSIAPDQKRVMIDVLKWQMARRSPKKWGDKVQHADADGEKLPAPPPFYVMGVVPAKQGE
ncbi:ubiquitin carboxyl-hydrolase [Stenotrophomonas maltophilia]|uniref:terminase small subunit-like protein n=1 Tax=Stenotrophomonas maltophilia TaxID=40324 RepID=UPI000C145DC2|nr:ubiquitin carboxyl-hydrolase [Stenotrophomonas maltophilia]